ncbi:MAG TPA: GNAT family N-acetyltransferase [Actinomycetota bacterium]|nr:GNAT family N-acetyltransferase [Actinomycetota bacterium]
MSDVVVRDAAPGDRDEIVRLMEEMKAHHRGFNPHEARFRFERGGVEGFVAGAVSDPEVTVLVAEGAGRLLAFVVFRLVEKSWGRSCEVDLLSVEEEHRGSGIGERMMEAVEERAQQSGAAGVRLAVSLGNDGALRFYERLGYERSSIRLGKDLGG